MICIYHAFFILKKRKVGEELYFTCNYFDHTTLQWCVCVCTSRMCESYGYDKMICSMI